MEKFENLFDLVLDSSESQGEYLIPVQRLRNALCGLDHQTNESQICLVLLNFISNNFSLLSLKTNHINKKDLSILQNISYSYYQNPYPNIYTELRSLSQDNKYIANLIKSTINVYKMLQLNYIEKFYSKITVSHLTDLVGKEIPIENPKFLVEHGWKKEKDYFIIEGKENQREKFNSKEAMSNLEFLGKLNTALDKVTQANILIKNNESDLKKNKII